MRYHCVYLSIAKNNTMKKIAIIAGEVSGDILGSRLIKALKQHHPDVQFEGIGGAEMQAEDCHCLYPMERLSVMGFSEVLSRLFELLSIRKNLIQRWTKNPPDLIIGIDAPDFNLALEAKLHKVGIPTVHYVSPSIWAWRENRVKKMQGNIDLMLTLFPFEVDFYQKHHIKAQFVGHPLADEIPLNIDQTAARKSLNLPIDQAILAILPGSRSGEIQRLSPAFLQAAAIIQDKYPTLMLVSPMINTQRRQQFESIKQRLTPNLDIHLIDGQSRTVMMAADTLLMASGTAVLEGMLVGRPMLAAYKVSAMTAAIIRVFKMIKAPYFTLANNLAGEALVPELIQAAVTVENIVNELERLLHHDDSAAYRQQRFQAIHQQLSINASQAAAQAIVDYMASRHW